MDIHELLNLTIKNDASDLHLLVGIPPALRIDGALRYLSNYDPLNATQISEMVFTLLSEGQKAFYLKNKELDFSFGFGGGTFGNLGRFRANVYYQRGYVSAAFRFLRPNIRTVEELHLPKVVSSFSDFKQGFILITGPTGHGKSTTIAAIINEINVKRAAHILTIEDPIEYIYPSGKSIISQREINIDTMSWNNALKSSLREDPDVVLIGEMRDPETVASAITIAETGHLVFSTLHTNSAAQSIDRIIDSFPSDQQSQIRVQLAATLKGIISQRLLPMINGSRMPAVEVLIGNSAIANNIREGKTHLIDSIIQTSQDQGMVTLEASLASLVLNGSISLDTAKSYTFKPEELARLVS